MKHTVRITITTTDTTTVPGIPMVEGKTSATTTVSLVAITATHRVKDTILGETVTGTVVVEPEFTSGSIDNNKSVITNKLNEVT